MREQFTFGQQVVWQSQAAGVVKTKRGTIEQVVPAGARPDRDRFAALYRSSGVGAPRDHVSYVIRVAGRTATSAGTIYWPRVSALQADGARAVVGEQNDKIPHRTIAWSGATGDDGYRRCLICGAFVRDNADLGNHCCNGVDDD